MEWREFLNCSGEVGQSGEDKKARPGAGIGAKRWLGRGGKERGEEIGSAVRRSGGGAWRKAPSFWDCGTWFHAATASECGGERSWIWAAVSLSMTTMGPPHSGQSQSGVDSLAEEVSDSVCGGHTALRN